MRMWALRPRLVSWVWGTAQMRLPLGSLSENDWPSTRRVGWPRVMANSVAFSMRMPACSLERAMMTMRRFGVWSAAWRALMEMVVVLPHWRLQQSMRYLAGVSRTSACLALGVKPRCFWAHSEVLAGSGLGFSGVVGVRNWKA